MGAGTGTTSLINSNTSGSTPVTLQAGTNVTLSEAGNTITISAAGGGADQTLAVATNTTTLSAGGGSMTIAGAGINVASTSGNTITVTGTEVDGLTTNEGSLTVGAGTGTTSLINSNTSGSTPVTITAAGILTTAESGNVITLTATEVDGSTTNELQTLAVATNTTTLSAGGGSMTIAGAGINVATTSGNTITVTGTEVDGLTTNEGSLTVGAGTGTTSLINSNTSGSTPVTITAAGILTTAESGNVITLTATEVDGSTTNELQTLSATGTGGGYNINLDPSGGSIGINQGNKTTINRSGNTLTFNSNEYQGFDNTSDATSHTLNLKDGFDASSAGTIQFVEGTGISLATTGSATNGILTISSTAGADQTLAVASNTTTLSAGGGSMTIAGAGINAASTSGSTITVTGTEVDGLTTNEGSLTVGAGTGTTSLINSNTSGSTPVTISVAVGLNIAESGNTITLTPNDIGNANEGSLTVGAGTGTTSLINSNTAGSTPVTLSAGSNITLSESGNTITIASTAGSQNGYYGGNGGNGGDNTIPSVTKSTLTNQLTLEIGDSPLLGLVPFRINATNSGAGVDQDFMTIRNGSDSLYFLKQDDAYKIIANAPLQLGGRTIDLNADSIRLNAVPNAFAGENTYLMRSPGGYVTKKEGISGATITSSIITPSTITSDQDNYNPTGWNGSNLVRLSGDNGIRAITSFVAPTSGFQKTLVNVGSYPIYFPSEHPDGTAANRVLANYDYILYPGASTAMYYDGTSSRWRFLSRQPAEYNARNLFYQWSPGSSTAADWGDFGFFQSVVSQAATSGLPASFDIGTSTTSTGLALAYFGKSLSSISVFGDAHLSYSTFLSIPVLSDGTNSFTAAAQITTSATSLGLNYNNAVGIRYNHATNSGKWEGYSRSNSGTESTIDLGITVTANQLYRLGIEVDKTLSEIRFYVDDVFIGRVQSNLPDPVGCSPRVIIAKSAGTTARLFRIHNMATQAIYP